MLLKSYRVMLAITGAFIASSAITQTVVGAESPSSKFNRLRDIAVRPMTVNPPARPNVFGTAAVGAGVTFYDARFRRVSLSDRNDPAVLDIAARLRGLSPTEQLAVVQREVLARVKWSTDLETMHVADLWANAGETLRRGAGDSEDIAIVQMQALKAAGFNPRDLYISIGRRKPVGAHIVLLARTPDGFMVLDDRIGRPMPALSSSQFTPVLTIGEGKSWVHGRPVGGMTAHASAR